MRYIFVLLSVLAFSCNSGKQSDENKLKTDSSNAKATNTWSNEDQISFMDDCINAASGQNLSRDSAEKYCACVLTKAQTVYPDYEDVDKKITMEQVNKWAGDCLSK